MTNQDEVRGWREEFEKEFATTHYRGAITRDAMTDWWLSKFDTLLANKREEAKKLREVGSDGEPYVTWENIKSILS